MIAISTVKTYAYSPSSYLTVSERDEFERVKREHKKLSDENCDLKDQNEELRKEIGGLTDQIKKLEKELKRYKEQEAGRTVATPSSKQFPKSSRPPKGSRPRGAPKGHRGSSLKVPEKVDQIVVHSPERCPICNCSNLGKETDGWTQTVLDIKPTPIIPVTHEFKRRWCPICKKKVAVKSEETLPHRNYGPNLAVVVSYLVEMGLPLPKIQSLIKTVFQCTISQPELMALANLVGDALKAEYQRLIEELRNSPAVNADETGFRVNGDNKWCWVFVWENGTLYMIHESRGAACPKEVLGEKYQGVLGRDGWKAYDKIDCEQQVDYIHINRQFQKVEIEYGVKDRSFLTPTQAEFMKEGPPSKEVEKILQFLDDIRSLMRDAVKFTERQPPPDVEERFLMLEQFLDRFKAIMGKDWQNAEISRLQTSLQEHSHQFFTFVIFPEIGWDNNIAERGVRKVATVRNNSGGRRSWKGAETLQILLSVFSSFSKRGLDVLRVVRTALLNFFKNDGSVEASL